MTTTTLHGTVQRGRFANHAWAMVSEAIAPILRLPTKLWQPFAALGPAQIAALEASRVRRLAYSYSKTDPGFAADLYAAAARHEGLYAD